MKQERFFEEFYREHFENLVTYAYGYTRDRYIAQDVVQDAFHILLRKEKMQEFLESPNQIGWMKTVVKNVARNAVRARQRQAKWLVFVEEMDLNLVASGTRSKEDEEAVLQRYAEFLSPQEIYLLKRLVLDRATYTELKDELGISMWACYKRVERMEQSIAAEVSKRRLLRTEEPKKEKVKN